MRSGRLAILLLLCVGGAARAELLDRSAHQRPMVFSLFAGVPYYGGFGPAGLGLRFYVPILHDGFVRPLNDEFGIEFGADFTFYGVWSGVGGYGFSIPVEVLWDFHLHPRFDVYAKLGVTFTLPVPGYPGGVVAPFFVYPVGSVGLRFHLTSWFYLRAEAGYPWLKVGIGFAF